ncbi:hypothetical protein Tco_0244478 [Tanacetum coccineum]
MFALRSAESRCKGGNEVGSGIGKSGGVPNDGASDLVWESMMGGGLAGGGDDTCKGDSIVILVVVIVLGVVMEKESEAVMMTMGKVVMVVE